MTSVLADKPWQELEPWLCFGHVEHFISFVTSVDCKVTLEQNNKTENRLLR